MAIRAEVLGPDHPDLAISELNLGILLARVGDAAGSLAAHERAAPPAPLAAEALFGLGRELDGEGYAACLGQRHVLAAAYSAFLDRFGLILGPVSTHAPWPVGHDLGGPDALRDEWWGFRLTVATACLGLPVVSVPVGSDERGLPVGVQLIAPRWQERSLLAAAAAIESAVSSPRDIAQE
jgi:amidase